jgi:hypothetical protein
MWIAGEVWDDQRLGCQNRLVAHRRFSRDVKRCHETGDGSHDLALVFYKRNVGYPTSGEARSELHY